MELVPKAGIIFGIAATSIFLSIWIPVTIVNNEYLIAKVFYDTNIHLEKLQQTESYKAMLERYPDAAVSSRASHMFAYLEMKAYGDDPEKMLSISIHYDPMDDFISESARCNMGSSQKVQLGTIPPEIIHDPPIPKYMFVRGDADGAFTADFIRYTNCLDAKVEDELEPLYADYYIAIPEGTSKPGCEPCFEPPLLTVRVGDVVSFRNFDSERHTVTSGTIDSEGHDGLFDSGLIAPGGKFLYEFAEAGEYDYFCVVHPWKTGTILVYQDSE